MSERSGKYNFYKPSRDGNDIADINEITTNFTIIDENIPSNTDLAEAVGLANSKGTWETIADTTIAETVSQYIITTDKNYKKLFIRIEMTEDTSQATELGRVQLLMGGQPVWSDGSGWIGKTKSGSTTLKGTSNPKVIIFDIDVAENCTMIRARGAWNRTTIEGIDLYATHMYNPEGVGFGYDDWGTTSVVLNKGATTNKIGLYFRSTAYPLFAGSRVIIKGVQS